MVDEIVAVDELSRRIFAFVIRHENLLCFKIIQFIRGGFSDFKEPFIPFLHWQRGMDNSDCETNPAQRGHVLRSNDIDEEDRVGKGVDWENVLDHLRHFD